MGSRAVRTPDSFALLRQRFYDRLDNLIRCDVHSRKTDYLYLVPIVVANAADDIYLVWLELG